MKIKQLIASFLIANMALASTPLEALANTNLSTNTRMSPGTSGGRLPTPGGIDVKSSGFGYILAPSVLMEHIGGEDYNYYDASKSQDEQGDKFIASVPYSAGLTNSKRFLANMMLPYNVYEGDIAELRQASLIALNATYRPEFTTPQNAGQIYFVAAAPGATDIFGFHRRTGYRALTPDNIKVGYYDVGGGASLNFFSPDNIDQGSGLYLPDSARRVIDNSKVPTQIDTSAANTGHVQDAEHNNRMMSIFRGFFEELIVKHIYPYYYDSMIASEQAWDDGQVLTEMYKDDKQYYMQRMKLNHLSYAIDATFGTVVAKEESLSFPRAIGTIPAFDRFVSYWNRSHSYWRGAGSIPEKDIRKQAGDIVDMLMYEGRLATPGSDGKTNLEKLIGNSADSAGFVQDVLDRHFKGEFAIGNIIVENMDTLDSKLWEAGDSDTLYEMSGQAANPAVLFSGIEILARQVIIGVAGSIIGSHSIFIGLADEPNWNKEIPVIPANPRLATNNWMNFIEATFNTYAMRTPSEFMSRLAGVSATSSNEDVLIKPMMALLVQQPATLLRANQFSSAYGDADVFMVNMQHTFDMWKGVTGGTNTSFRENLHGATPLVTDAGSRKGMNRNGWFFSKRGLDTLPTYKDGQFGVSALQTMLGSYRVFGTSVENTDHVNMVRGAVGWYASDQALQMNHHSPLQILHSLDTFAQKEGVDGARVEGIGLAALIPPSRGRYADVPERPPEPGTHFIKAPRLYFSWNMQVNEQDFNESDLRVERYNKLDDMEENAPMEMDFNFDHHLSVKTENVQLWQEYFNGRPERPRIPGEEGNIPPTFGGEVGEVLPAAPSPNRPMRGDHEPDREGTIFHVALVVQRLRTEPNPPSPAKQNPAFVDGDMYPNAVNFVPHQWIPSLHDATNVFYMIDFKDVGTAMSFIQEGKPLNFPEMKDSNVTDLGKPIAGNKASENTDTYGDKPQVNLLDDREKQDTIGNTIPNPIPGVIYNFYKAFEYQAKLTYYLKFVGDAEYNEDTDELWIVYTDDHLKETHAPHRYNQHPTHGVRFAQYENEWILPEDSGPNARMIRQLIPRKWIGWRTRYQVEPEPEGVQCIEYITSDAESFSEMKHGEPRQETWEAMAGVPTTESLYYAVGGTVFVIDMAIVNHSVMANSRHDHDGWCVPDRDHDLVGRISRTYSWSNPTTSCQHNGDVPCGNNDEGFNCHGKTGHGVCGEEIPGDPPSSCGTSHPAPIHSNCNGHTTGGYSHTWTNWIENAQYIQILWLNVWKLEQGYLEGMEKLIVENGNRNQMGTERFEDEREYYRNLQAQPYTQQEPTLFWNIAEADLSQWGRVHYSFEPQMFDRVSYVGPSDSACITSCAECPDTQGPKPEGTEALGNEDEASNWSGIYDVRQTITVLSDTAILRTPTGDIPVLYYEQVLENVPVALKEWSNGRQTPGAGTDWEPEGYYYPLTVDPDEESQWRMPDVTYAEMWNNNPMAIKSWLRTPTTMDTISYDGNWQEASKTNQSAKYESTILVPKINMDTDTKFGNGSSQGAESLNHGTPRRARNATGWCTDHSVFEDGVGRIEGNQQGYTNILGIMTASHPDTIRGGNRTYRPTPGRHYQPAATEITIKHPSMEIGLRLHNGEYYTGNSHLMYRAILNYKSRPTEYDIEPDTRHFGNIPGFQRTGTYSRNHSRINNVLLHNPVSVQYAFPHSLPDSRDQRMTDTSPIMRDANADEDNIPYVEFQSTRETETVRVGNQEFAVAGFWNIDWGAQYYYPNLGDFDRGQPYAIGELTYDTGWNYTGVPLNSDYDPGGTPMYTHDWVERKWINTSVDVIFEGEMYLAGDDIVIFDRGRDYYNQNDDYGRLHKENFRLYLPLNNNEQAPGWIDFKATAINAPNRTHIHNWDRLNVMRPEPGRAYSAHHDAYRRYYIDVVGRVGNLTMEHVQDPNFETTFKQVASNQSNPATWLIPNLVPSINNQAPFRYVGQTVDIRKVPIQGVTIEYLVYDEENQYTSSNEMFTDTYGRQPSRSGQVPGSVGMPIEFPLTSGKNQWSLRDIDFPAANRSEEVLLGYNALLDFATIGNYQNGSPQLVPNWYFVDLDTEEWIPVDVYDQINGRYELIHRHGLANDQNLFNTYYNVPPSRSPVYRAQYVIDWEEEEVRRNKAFAEMRRIYNFFHNVDEDMLIAANEENLPEERVTLADIQNGPAGRNNAAGTAQIITLESMFNRTYFGSEHTNGTFNNPGNKISPTAFQMKGQLWHWLIGLPATSIPVISEQNRNWMILNQDPSVELLESLRARNGVLVSTVSINIAGHIWTLDYKPETFIQELNLWKPEVKGPVTSLETSSGIRIPQTIDVENPYPDPYEPYEPLLNTPGEWVTIPVPEDIFRNEHILMTVETETRSIDTLVPSGTH